MNADPSHILSDGVIRIMGYYFFCLTKENKKKAVIGIANL